MAALSDKSVANARRGEHSDDLVRGLILMVRPSTAKDQPGAVRRTWVLRFSRGGKRQRIGLGAYPLVGLAAARRKARDALRAIDEGKDPSRVGKARLRADLEASVLTFGRAVDRYLSKVAQPLKNTKNDHSRERGLRLICATLHPHPVERITPLDVAAILRSLRPGTARKTQSALRALFTFAMVEMAHRGVHFLNPASADLLKAVGYAPRRAHVRYAALHFQLIPEFMHALEAIDTPTARCLRFIALTASRSAAARLMRFDQVNFDARVWRCPAEQMKDLHHRSEAFVVPLSDAALEVIGKPGSSHYVFSACDGEPINDMTLITLTRALRRGHDDWLDPDSGKPFVIHGFRDAFRRWAQFPATTATIAELVIGHSARPSRTRIRKGRSSRRTAHASRPGGATAPARAARSSP